jgi:clan AA aspartic protease
MGFTKVTVTVRNPAKPRKAWKGSFLVDTGSWDSLVPAKRLRALGFVPEGKRKYGLADGTEKMMDICVAKLEFMGEIAGNTIVFGADNAEPILGVTALEAAGVEVDPRTHRLKRLPASPLK